MNRASVVWARTGREPAASGVLPPKAPRALHPLLRMQSLRKVI
jgi:hypothetical protein